MCYAAVANECNNFSFWRAEKEKSNKKYNLCMYVHVCVERERMNCWRPTHSYNQRAEAKESTKNDCHWNLESLLTATFLIVYQKCYMDPSFEEPHMHVEES